MTHRNIYRDKVSLLNQGQAMTVRLCPRSARAIWVNTLYLCRLPTLPPNPLTQRTSTPLHSSAASAHA
jgi:hypothetical protein